MEFDMWHDKTFWKMTHINNEIFFLKWPILTYKIGKQAAHIWATTDLWKLVSQAEILTVPAKNEKKNILKQRQWRRPSSPSQNDVD